MTLLLVLSVLGYLCGCVPFGRILMVLFANTQMDSPGTANLPPMVIWQTGRHRLALAAAALEMAKCALPTALAASLCPQPYAAVVVAATCVTAHFFSPLARWVPTLGISPVLGGMMVLDFTATLLAGILWLAVTLSWRRPPLASLCVALALPMLMFFNNAKSYELIGAIACALVIFATHHKQVARLMKKREPAWF
jgi:glycerol-3-phosphate acyltransferase PlsY